MNQIVFSIVLGFFLRKVRMKYGEGVAREVRTEAKKEYREIIPYVPKVGGIKNYFSGIAVANGWFIATYKAMKPMGYTAEDVMTIWAEIVDGLFRKMPGWLRVRIGKFLTSDQAIKGFHKQAKRSQLRDFPGDWVYQINEVQGTDLAIEFQECAAIKMYRELRVQEMSPFCSFADVTYSTYLGIGIDATETLGLGFPSCKLYYQREGGIKFNQRIQPILPAHLVENPNVQAVEVNPG
ncbi:hypothetical protein ACFLXI_10290 [Chloroflexota bacterium]